MKIIRKIFSKEQLIEVAQTVWLKINVVYFFKSDIALALCLKVILFVLSKIYICIWGLSTNCLQNIVLQGTEHVIKLKIFHIFYMYILLISHLHFVLSCLSFY